LQKNIYYISIGAGVFLGFSLAYFFQILFIMILEPGISESLAIIKKFPVQSRRPQTVYKSIDDVRMLVGGNFMRDSVRDRSADIQISDGAGGQIILFGVIAGHPSIASAAIQVAGENKVNEYRPGKMVAGYKIAAIHYDGITIERGGTRIKLKIGEQSGQAAAPSAGASIPGAEKITISRDRVLTLSQNSEAIMRNKFAPITKNNKIAGFKLIYVPEDNNFLYEMGARSGDIIRRFNGQPLESNEKLFEIWQSIKTSSRVTIEVERGGKILPFEIEIQN
ncbi:MAG: hypothetical protein OEZ34_12785, partial [Spirochaetia bacterium]|nr:hypothetical protein [Spirochaetia bacterium]